MCEYSDRIESMWVANSQQRRGTDYKSAPAGGLGGWVVAQSPILNTTITVDRLVKRGYEPLITWYRKVAPEKFTPTLFPFV